MASTGFQAASNTTLGAAASGSSWTGQSNLLTDDTNIAEHEVDGSGGFTTPTQQLHIKNFGFNIPAGATITGIEIQGRGTENTGLGLNAYFLLADGFSSTYGNAQFELLADGIDGASPFSLGGDGNTFSASLTPAIVNSSDFGFLLYYAGNSPGQTFVLAFQYVEMNVYFTGGGGGSGVSLAQGVSKIKGTSKSRGVTTTAGVEKPYENSASN